MKTALITGGAKRVGKSMVEYLASRGWNVVIHANRSIKDAEELAHLLDGKYPSQSFDAVSFNLSDWKNARKFIDDLLKKHKKIDLLINNASKYSPGKLEKTEELLLEEMTAIHYYSPLLMSKQLVSIVKETIIVNFLDAAIVNNHTEHSAYLLAKKNLTEFTKMAAVEWAPNVRVNAIAPGPVLPVAGKEDAVFEEVVKKTPLQIPVDLSSILKTLDFILDNNNITGQVLFCDSGQHLL
ncbi:SDR family NAD(P)-dependent oxidoreductase [Carboxylicivirga linearis]|uniref:SDR family NAD(P)-dependent oxidoreductase n=1 Tax=Carboxylicivirga linearis TaxID=1628157 RepID=A0ABS5JQZ3_9BACT|nr:SDR family NAD(P)-dependent oxidoreductase [Carboxylicivirga linearis]MBS2097289.1 SDR family NAD(P)-dependent oxidoreductase [Carboxylicivirga linearis]